MDKIATVVILFNPNKKTVENILTYVNKIEKLFVTDNSSTLSQYIRFDFLQEKTVLIHDGDNKGIAARLNQVCELAIEDGFEYLLTMDQDSYFDESAITNYF